MDLIEQFEKEFNAAVCRYTSKRDSVVNLPTKAAFIFEDTFNEWKQIEYAWDRKRCIFTALDAIFGETLQLWQLSARLIDDRFPEKALELAIQKSTDTDLLTPEFWAIVAKANFILRNYQDAEEDIKKCLGLDENHQMGLLVLADIYYWTGRTNEALQIFHKILNDSVKEEQKKELNFADLVGFAGGLVCSPMYAFAWLKEDKNATAAAWGWAENEFYFSPQFRSQYAYWLLNQEKIEEGFKKILYLSQEMPFFKEAVINSRQLIAQFQLETQLIEETARLDKIIVSNNWQQISK